MFNKKRLPVDGNEPPIGAAIKVRLQYFSLFQESQRQNYILWVAVFLLIGVVLVMAMSITYMQPLQREVPYFLTNDPNVKGRVIPTDIVAQKFNPATEQKRYHIEEWCGWLWTIDPALTETNLSRANVLTVGAATNVLRELINKQNVFKRMEKEPDLKREATVLETNFIKDDVAIVRIALIEKKNGISQKPEYVSMTIHYALVPPKKKADTDRSPIGLTITDFSWTEARV